MMYISTNSVVNPNDNAEMAAFRASADYQRLLAGREYERWGRARQRASRIPVDGYDTTIFWIWVAGHCLANEIGWASR